MTKNKKGVIQILDAKIAHQNAAKNVLKQIDSILGKNDELISNYEHVVDLINDAISKGACATVVGGNAYYSEVIDILRLKNYYISNRYNPGHTRIISWHPSDKYISGYMFPFKLNDYDDYHLYEPVSELSRPVQFLGQGRWEYTHIVKQ